MPDPTHPKPRDLAAIDAVVVRLRSGERIRSLATDTGAGSTTDTTGELWFDGFAFRVRVQRRLRRKGRSWSPTSIEDRAFDEVELRARLGRDPDLRALVGLP